MSKPSLHVPPDFSNSGQSNSSLLADLSSHTALETLSHPFQQRDLQLYARAADSLITAIAQGSPTPSTTRYPNTVTNGDFLIQGNSIATLIGDGADESTTWTFDFTTDPDFTSLTHSTLLASAQLTLTLEPTNGLITTDGITIQGLGSIVQPIRELPVGEASTITIDLLDYFSPDTVVQAIQRNAGRLSTTYQDDAVISFAQLELSTFDSGIFTVGESGEVGVDFLFDGGAYQGELVVFSLEGMGQYKPGSAAFIQEAARRALTNSTLGHVVISDQVEGARFKGILGAHEGQDWNAGEYSGNKTFLMRPGDRFGFMLVPNGWTSEVFRDPDSCDPRKLLFSMTTAHPDSPFSVKQFADVTGDRHTFGWEDLKLPNSDRDYNDIIFQIKGAKGSAFHIDDLIDPAKEWRNSQPGQELVQSVVDPLDRAGNTANQALQALPSTVGRTYRGWIGSLDPDDFYSFSLGMTNEFNLSLDGLSENANVEVLDFDGNVVFSSTNAGKAAESISGLLEHGAYRIRVFSEGDVGTPYNLKLSVNPTIAGLTTTGSEALFDIDLVESSRLINMDDFRSGNLAQGWRSQFSGIDGRGFTTVIIDSGIDAAHPFFGPDINQNRVRDRIFKQHDFANNDPIAEDNSGHGTHVSSIVTSQDPTFTGMAPGVNLVHLKVWDNTTNNSNEQVFGRVEQALQWVVANATALNIASVNMSFSDRYRDTIGNRISGNHQTPQQLFGINDELAMLNSQGVILVSTASNFFSNHGNIQGVAYPAADPNTIAVSSVNDGSGSSIADQVSGFSQRDANLTDIFAPGAIIEAAQVGGGTVNNSGTSMAAPHITGMAVLAQQLAERTLGRRLSPSEFRDLLYQTGTPINDPITGVTTFRRADMLALANAITPPEPIGDTQIITIPAPTIQRLDLDSRYRTRGDDEFDGHGPFFRIETHLGSNRSTLWTSVSAFFEETRSDWTTFARTSDPRLIFNVEEQYPGWEIASVETPTFDLLEGVDQDHEVNYYSGTTPLVERYAVQGDTRQRLGIGSDEPWVTVFFNPIQVTLRRIT